MQVLWWWDLVLFQNICFLLIMYSNFLILLLSLLSNCMLWYVQGEGKGQVHLLVKCKMIVYHLLPFSRSQLVWWDFPDAQSTLYCRCILHSKIHETWDFCTGDSEAKPSYGMGCRVALYMCSNFQRNLLLLLSSSTSTMMLMMMMMMLTESGASSSLSLCE